MGHICNELILSLINKTYMINLDKWEVCLYAIFISLGCEGLYLEGVHSWHSYQKACKLCEWLQKGKAFFEGQFHNWQVICLQIVIVCNWIFNLCHKKNYHKRSVVYLKKRHSSYKNKYITLLKWNSCYVGP